MFTLTWVHTCLIDFLQEDAAGMKCLAEVIPCSDSTSLWLMIPNMYKTKTKKKANHGIVWFTCSCFCPVVYARKQSTHLSAESTEKCASRSRRGWYVCLVTVSAWWIWWNILLILNQGRKQPLTSCTNQTRPQISYAIFWFNKIFSPNLTDQILLKISTRHMLSSASAGTLARPWKTASACWRSQNLSADQRRWDSLWGVSATFRNKDGI